MKSNQVKTLQLDIKFYLTVLFSFTLYVLSIQWQWSLFMDDTYFNEAYRGLNSFMDAVTKEHISLFEAGRFTPIKALMNVLKWRMGFDSPWVIHFINLCLYLISVLMIVFSIKDLNLSRFKLFILIFCYLLIQRPVLDTLALSTIPESYVILFISAGVYFNFCKNRNVILSRIFFLLASFSKEPACVAFFAIGLSGIASIYLFKKNKHQLYLSIFDLLIFFILALGFRELIKPGAYIENYSLLSTIGFYKFLIGLFKISIGLILFAVVLFVNRSKIKVNSILSYELIIFLILFGMSYLYLVSVRIPAGYLILPAAYAFQIAGFLVVSKVELSFYKKIYVKIGFLLLVGISLFRFDYFVRGINEPSYYLPNYIKNINQGETILVMQNEIASSMRKLCPWKDCVLEYGSVEYVSWLKTLKQNTRLNHDKKVVLFEFTGYFGSIDLELFNELRIYFKELKEIKFYSFKKYEFIHTE